MLTITPIRNVQNTINNKLSFQSGVRTNYGADAINNTADIKHEGSFFTDFLGTIQQSPIFLETFKNRQQSIEKGLSEDTTKFNAIA